MGNPVEIKDKIIQEGKILDKQFHRNLLYLSLFLFLCLVLLLVLYIWKIPVFIFSESINAERWGQFGDLYGGVIGTFITFISIIFLYKAFKEQRIANVQAEETNAELFKQNTKQLYNVQLQLYDNHFNRLFNLYQNALSNYNVTVLEKFSNDLLEKLLLDINIECLNYSNFRIYSRSKFFHRTYSNGENTIFTIIVKNTYPIIVSYLQVKNPQ